MLNLNEAAFDPKNDLLPSLGQNMGSYNILTNSILRQSQIGQVRNDNESMESVAALATGMNDVSVDEVADGEEYPDINLFA